MSDAIDQAVALLDGAGYIVIPPQDLPTVRVDEDKLLAVIDDMNWTDFAGKIHGRSIEIGSRWFDNYSEENEYRRMVAHAAMLLWYRQNLEHEKAVSDRARELLAADGIAHVWQAKKKDWRKAVKRARRELAAAA